MKAILFFTKHFNTLAPKFSTLKLSKFRWQSIKVGKYTLAKIKGAKAQNHVAAILFSVINKICCFCFLLSL